MAAVFPHKPQRQQSASNNPVLKISTLHKKNESQKKKKKYSNEKAYEIDVDFQFPEPVVHDSGIIYDDVYTAESFYGGVESFFELRIIRHVAFAKYRTIFPIFPRYLFT